MEIIVARSTRSSKKLAGAVVNIYGEAIRGPVHTNSTCFSWKVAASPRSPSSPVLTPQSPPTLGFLPQLSITPNEHASLRHRARPAPSSTFLHRKPHPLRSTKETHSNLAPQAPHYLYLAPSCWLFLAKSFAQDVR
ncbi:hypothetical protein GOP47_0025352 [Adiantum capillus-veneris]|uniref:Uncharacterized protein n=1 Tax=Adiantum capillus-veneris TaxID=13818 RepID=A0A9D4Z286_ADICA|nr:hypothetical protein GOP47_0025352 [Adiantum capillus-veneris]